MDKRVREFLSDIGRKGGQVKSDAKANAVRRNLEKARATKLRRVREGDT